MKKPERAALAELLSVVEDLLEKSPNGEPITLTKHERQQLKDSYGGVMAFITGHRRDAQARMDEANLLMKVIRNRKYQLKLTDEKGNPLEEPVEREVEDTDQPELPFDADDDDSEDDDDSDEEDDEEPEAITETFENGVTATWPPIPGVPPHVQAGLIQSIRDGNTKAKACDLVAKEVGLDKFALAGYFEDLVRAGIFEKRGREWVAHLPTERPPAEASIG